LPICGEFLVCNDRDSSQLFKTHHFLKSNDKLLPAPRQVVDFPDSIPVFDWCWNAIAIRESPIKEVVCRHAGLILEQMQLHRPMP